MIQRNLILSLFPGLGVLDEGFRLEGFTVVSAGDVCWTGFNDIRSFKPPSGVFEGIIGGDPCQSHSGYANLLRSKGMETRFGDLSKEMMRVIRKAAPVWYLRENIAKAPPMRVRGYFTHDFLLDNADLGEEQQRTRRFTFGNVDETIDLTPYLDTSKRHENPKQTVTGRHLSYGMGPAKPGNPARYSIEESLRLQGLPKDLLDHSPMTVEGKRRLVGNAVPLPMARALARAVKEAMR